MLWADSKTLSIIQKLFSIVVCVHIVQGGGQGTTPRVMDPGFGQNCIRHIESQDEISRYYTLTSVVTGGTSATQEEVVRCQVWQEAKLVPV